MKKAALFLALLPALALAAPIALAQPRPAAKAPSYVGRPFADDAGFERFIIQNLNRRVYLKIAFESDEVSGYKSAQADPFLALHYSYFFDCQEKQDRVWSERCSKLNPGAGANEIKGYFRVTEPKPTQLRTNRMFTLVPTP